MTATAWTRGLRRCADEPGCPRASPLATQACPLAVRRRRIGRPVSVHGLSTLRLPRCSSQGVSFGSLPAGPSTLAPQLPAASVRFRSPDPSVRPRPDPISEDGPAAALLQAPSMAGAFRVSATQRKSLRVRAHKAQLCVLRRGRVTRAFGGVRCDACGFSRGRHRMAQLEPDTPRLPPQQQQEVLEAPGQAPAGMTRTAPEAPR
jgi:hypothetical protein